MTDMNAPSVGIRRRWIQVRLRTVLVLTFVVAVVTPVFSGEDQDRERRKRIQLEKTLNMWDYPATRPESPSERWQSIDAVQEIAPAHDTSRSSFGGSVVSLPPPADDLNVIVSAPEPNIHEHERLEWLRIQVEAAFNPSLVPNLHGHVLPGIEGSSGTIEETLVVSKQQDRERRKRIQLEKTLEIWDSPPWPRLDAVLPLESVTPKNPVKLPPIRRRPPQPRRPPLL